jgi:aspartyl/asparaginyl beta-hydroxylase (cupin superfamily)
MKIRKTEAGKTMHDAELKRLLAEAAEARAAGRLDLAEARFQAVAAARPDHAGALNALGMIALAAGRPGEAAERFRAAVAADPEAAPLRLNLASAYRRLGDDEAERAALAAVLEQDQRHLMALIRMAELHERLGEHQMAVHKWGGVVALGRMLDERPPGLEEVLRHASDYLSARNRRLAETLEAGLAGPMAAASALEQRRFTACMDYMLGRRAIYANQCAGLHYPFLPADEFFDRGHFPWLPALEARTAEIRAEAEALLASPDPGLSPYVAMDPGTPQNKWSELDHSLAWGALHLWREGQRIDDACARCPRTAEIVEALPLARIPGRAPTVFFSVLKPRTRLPAHTGVSNIRTIVHLPLIVPPGCGFRVGGETREWREGEAFAFDDTIEHEAWNDSDRLRAVLILDVWNPHLSETERALVADFFTVADSSGQDLGERGAVGDAR